MGDLVSSQTVFMVGCEAMRNSGVLLVEVVTIRERERERSVCVVLEI